MIRECYAGLFGLWLMVWSGLGFSADCQPPTPSAAVRTPPVQVQGRHFVDPQGRVLLLRGINVSGDAKVPPFYGVTAAQQLDPLPRWGFNTLRLLFTWEAFEPAPCDYDESYLQYYEQVTRWAAERDLYVIVDFHQDAFSRFSNGGCGEGFPAWAVHSSIALQTPRNHEAVCESWGTRMLLDLSHHRTWYHFHRDSEGARSRFLAMVERVAARMASHDNVIGYDVLNEPWGTNRELLSLYEDAGRAIRHQDPEAMLFIPPHAFLSSGLVGNGIPRPELENFAYAPHFYDPIMITFKWWLGNSSAPALNIMARQAEEWDVPLFLGEFGAPAATRGGAAYIRQLYDWLDSRFASSAHWNYTPNWNDQTLDGWNLEDLSITAGSDALRQNYAVRPYPLASAGAPLQLAVSEQQLRYRWQHDPRRGGTELFVPEDWWQEGLTWEAPGPCRQRGLTLQCGHTAPGAVEVVLTRGAR
ncbi:MAG: cellulase family glycosylhydrolase [Pseudomonadota bacterium]|nr:cellulase family glycosylhydrolase [Pseudomonadota bacterium]